MRARCQIGGRDREIETHRETSYSEPGRKEDKYRDTLESQSQRHAKRKKNDQDAMQKGEIETERQELRHSKAWCQATGKETKTVNIQTKHGGSHL